MLSHFSIKPCLSCPSRKFGFCQNIFKIFGNELDAHLINQHSLLAKDYLFRQGGFYDGLFVLQSGWILLSRIAEDGKRQVFKSVLPGELLGFQPDHHGPAIYSAIAVKDCEVCTIPSAIQLCSSHPDLAMKLAWSSAYDILLTEMYLAKISQCNAKERIAFMVLELFRRLKLLGLCKNYTFQFPLKQEDIAEILGLTSIHVNRTLHVMKDEGLLSIRHHELTILDFWGLERLSGKDLEMLMVCETPINL